MKAVRRLRALVLVFAVLTVLLGFAVLYSPANVQARPPCTAWCMYCYIDLPICWCECCKWG